ncbi:MAG: hypothetical protein ACI4DP_03440 [Candidatus Ornithomonoglobus sp.]
MEENKNIDEAAEVKDSVSKDYNAPNDDTSQKDDAPIKILTKKLLYHFSQSSTKSKKIIIYCALIVSFVLGFALKSCTGVKTSDYLEIIRQKDKITESKEALQQEYDSYKEKMQPYEAQQQADVQAEEERKAAEEKAKKEAEEKAAQEKAAQEAEAKKAQEEALKNRSLGITQNEFYTSFNGIAANNGFDAFLGKSTEYGGYTTYKTLNDDVTVACSSQGGFVQSISITIKRTTSDSLTGASYYPVTVALSIDPSLSVDAVDSLMSELLSGAKNQYGNDYKQIKNSVEYSANVDDTSILFYYTKAK